MGAFPLVYRISCTNSTSYIPFHYWRRLNADKTYEYSKVQILRHPNVIAIRQVNTGQDIKIPLLCNYTRFIDPEHFPSFEGFSNKYFPRAIVLKLYFPNFCTVHSCWQSGQRLFCLIHKLIQQ